MRTAGLAVIAFLIGAAITFSVGFPLRFLYTSYLHGGLF